MTPVTPRPAVPNAALREIAGRIKGLSYRDMQNFAKNVFENLSGDCTFEQVTEALLAAADDLSKA